MVGKKNRKGVILKEEFAKNVFECVKQGNEPVAGSFSCDVE